jgi:hypothetical protein
MPVSDERQPDGRQRLRLAGLFVAGLIGGPLIMSQMRRSPSGDIAGLVVLWLAFYPFASATGLAAWRYAGLLAVTVLAGLLVRYYDPPYIWVAPVVAFATGVALLLSRWAVGRSQRARS